MTVNGSFITEKYAFLVLLNFLSFLKNTLYAFHQKCATTCVSEMSSGNGSHCLLNVEFFSFPVDLLELVFIQVFKVFWLSLRVLMLDC